MSVSHEQRVESPWDARKSAGLYLVVLAVGIVLSRYSGYLWFEQPIIKGQPANIVLFYLVFLISAIFWLRLDRRQRAKGWFLTFLLTMSIAWFVTLLLFRYHMDAFNYTAFLYVPILVMIALKPPTRSEAWFAILGFAWSVTLVLIATKVLEMVGILEVKYQTAALIAFDEERYFLPLNEFFGIEGRWPGPFGHNGDTAMMGALLVVIALAHWSKASWLFLFTGVITLTLTFGRASIGASLVGIIILLMFTNNAVISRVNRKLRIVIGLLALFVGAAILFSGAAGMTGRQNIWPAFLELWQQEPWLGVGGGGIAASGGLTEFFLHAHNTYIDLLARYGVLLFTAQMAALAIGVGIAIFAARKGQPGSLAILAAYLVTGLTEPRNGWMEPSVTGILVILAVAAAATSLSQASKDEAVSLQGSTDPNGRSSAAI